MSALWPAAEAADATGGDARGDWRATGVSIDTRTLAPGDLFVALSGDARDGHAFVADALARGAAAAMVARVPEGVAEDAPLLIVGDTLDGLRALAAAARARTRAWVIAVTGSAGKTTTKEMLRAILAGEGAVHAAEASFNNHWGVPLTLARLPADTDFAVLEIGMNHAGEIRPLTRLARPDVAVVTTVAEAHVGNFADGIEGVARAKAEIFEGLGPEGVAVLPADSDHLATLAAAAARARRIAFGAAGDADYRLVEASIAAGATVVRARLHGKPWAFRVGAPGRHLASNALAALAAAEAAGCDPARAALALGRWQAGEGRGARFLIDLGPGGRDGRIVLIDESYNANPASVRAALAVLATEIPRDGEGRIARGRRVAFLGDMLELGEAGEAMHAKLAEAPEIAGVDRVHCCGPAMRALWVALPAAKRGTWAPDSEGLAETARRSLDAGDVCVVKGSKAARMGRVVAAVKALGRTRPADPGAGGT
ncbi:MAG: UDP-N-acetylmuramoyl-tripeptide--D-alanyl-D-alanine ligase [Paracoccaceae bacterium]